jgi:8-oxoguanine deaminase
MKPLRDRIALTNIARVYTCDERTSSIDNAIILVEDGRILAIGASDEIDASGFQQIPLANRIVIPGLVNTHHHFFQHLTRSVPFVHRGRVLDWLGGLYPLWAELDADMMYWATMAACCELLLTGCTTVADCSYLRPKDDGSIVAAEVEAVKRAGLRFHLHHGSMPTIEGDLVERLRPIMGARLDHLLDDEAAIFRGMEQSILQYHDPSPHSMLRVAIGPTSLPYADHRLLHRFAELAAEADIGLHTHFHSGPSDWEGAGRRPLDLLSELGWIRPKTWFAHATRLDAEDIGRLTANGVGMSHCPRTIMRIGHGIAPVALVRRTGMRWSIATDGAASNDSGSMIGDVRTALLLHRVAGRPDADAPEDWMTPQDILKVGTSGGADVLHRPELGRIAVGQAADMTAFRIDTLSTAGAVADPLGAVLLSGTDGADLTMVAGRIRVRDGELVDIDATEIVDGLNRASRRMIAAARAVTGINFDATPDVLPLQFLRNMKPVNADLSF